MPDSTRVMTERALPRFEKPPAVETMMGCHFVDLPGWNPIYFGLLYAEFRDRYPIPQMLPLVIDPRKPQEVNLGMPPLRAGFADTRNSELVQVQSNLFFRNWRRTPESGYNHYANLKPLFVRDWEHFLAFLGQNGLGRPEILHVEVSYVNQLVRGTEWDSYPDLAKILKPFAARAEIENHGRHYAFLPGAATLTMQLGYTLPDLGVSLQAQANAAIRQPDGAEVIQLVISARSSAGVQNLDELTFTLDNCHDAVILGFEDFTTEYAHSLWGKQ
ncbi:MAG: TIGR04255 family protein [Acidobacteriaceae bacterium]